MLNSGQEHMLHKKLQDTNGRKEPQKDYVTGSVVTKGTVGPNKVNNLD
jgi:hypothetical protein